MTNIRLESTITSSESQHHDHAVTSSTIKFFMFVIQFLVLVTSTKDKKMFGDYSALSSPYDSYFNTSRSRTGLPNEESKPAIATINKMSTNLLSTPLLTRNSPTSSSSKSLWWPLLFPFLGTCFCWTLAFVICSRKR